MRTPSACWRLAVVAGSLVLTGCASSAPRVPETQLLGATDTRATKARVFVSPGAAARAYVKVAMMPFRAPTDLIGASVSDTFATELLRTHKYALVERSQMERVLGEQALALQGVTESATAVQVGKVLGVQGVVIGTVVEYGAKASAAAELAAVGLTVRMVDATDGTVVWSVSDSAVSDRPMSPSAFAQRVVQNMVGRLAEEWVKRGDAQASQLPLPRLGSIHARDREVVLELLADPADVVRRYQVSRRGEGDGPWLQVATVANWGPSVLRVLDQNLLPGTTYLYRALAQGRGGTLGPLSAFVPVTTPVAAPGPATGGPGTTGVAPDPRQVSYRGLLVTSQKVTADFGERETITCEIGHPMEVTLGPDGSVTGSLTVRFGFRFGEDGTARYCGTEPASEYRLTVKGTHANGALDLQSSSGRRYAGRYDSLRLEMQSTPFRGPRKLSNGQPVTLETRHSGTLARQ